MSEGKYIRLGTVQEVKGSMGQIVMKRLMGGPVPGGSKPVPVTGYSSTEQAIMKFLEGMPDDADVHIEVSKGLWR